MNGLKIHERGAGGGYEADDERANEIYDWYIGTFQKLTDTNLKMTFPE